VEADQEQVEVRVVAGGADGVDQLAELAVVQGPAAAAAPPRLGQRGGRVHCDQSRVGGAAKQGTQGGHAGLPGGSAGAAGTTALGPRRGVVDDGHEVLEGNLGQSPISQVGGGEAPVGPVGGGGGGVNVGAMASM
jgi:hypothetical protein